MFSAFFLFIQLCDASSSVSASEAAEAPTATAISSMSSMASIEPNDKSNINSNGHANYTTREFFRDNMYVLMFDAILSLILFGCFIKMQQEALGAAAAAAAAAEATYGTVSDDATTSTTKEEQKQRHQQDKPLQIFTGISFARPQ